MSNNKDPEIRYCKKCGCELVSTNKHKLCDNCRRERNANIRNGVLGAVGTVAVLRYLLLPRESMVVEEIKPEPS